MEFLDASGGKWNNLFREYNVARKADADAIAKMAIENYVEMRDLVAQKEFIHEKKIANKLSERCPGRFIPRYNMVSFTSIPYSEVYKRGKIQKKIISKLDIENPDLKMAEIMIQQKLHPIK